MEEFEYNELKVGELWKSKKGDYSVEICVESDHREGSDNYVFLPIERVKDLIAHLQKQLMNHEFPQKNQQIKRGERDKDVEQICHNAGWSYHSNK